MAPSNTAHSALHIQLLQEAANLHRTGNFAAAAAAYKKVLKKNPRNPDALHLLGVVLGQQGDAAGGLASIEKALSIRDDFPDAHMNAALIAGRSGDLERAEIHARKAVSLRPNMVTYNNLGLVLQERGHSEEALQAFRAAHECDPQNADGYVIYGRALRAKNDFATMLSVAKAGLRLAPDHPTLQLLSSEAHFGLGHLKEGWHAYRARFRALENKILPKNYPLPLWQGEDLKGRSIFIWAEQGIGDEIMYASMYAEIASVAKRCVAQCSRRLAPLMRRSFPTIEFHDRGLLPEELEGLDFQSPAGSLGEWLRPSHKAFPDRSSYLEADSDLRDQLKEKYRGDGDQLLVGIAWRSTNAHEAADKSLNILEWGPIFNVPGVTFVNLQYGDSGLELSEVARGFRVSIVNDTSVDPLGDVDRYAAQIAAMDLVISSSNAAAHIAGALGIPTFCMMPSSMARGLRWYWFATSGQSPWYSSVRLFKQREPGQWLSVLRDVGLALLDVVCQRGVSAAPYLRSMGQAFADMGRPEDAEAIYHRLGKEPGLEAEAYVHLGGLRKAALDSDGAFEYYDRALAVDPTYWHAHNSKGTLLSTLNRLDEAIAIFREGLQHNEASAQMHNNLAKALEFLGHNAEALEHYERALELTPPNEPQIHDSIALNCAGALHDADRPTDALRTLGDLLQRNPNNVNAHYNRSLILLSAGDLESGWQENVWRLKRPNANVRYESFSHIRPWAGEPLEGKKVLIWTEQGIGDEILTSTMIPDAIDAAKHVVVLCSSRLVPLFRRSFPKARVDERKEPLPKSVMRPDFDFQMSMSDLGLAFRRDLASFPSRKQILIPDEARRKAFRARYDAVAPGNLLVGLSWGSPKNTELGWLKSNQLASWRHILEVPDTTFVNLQYGDQSQDIAHIRENLGIEIINDASVNALQDMDTFAAQVAALDLVISVSNTTVHTAGAVGTPVWVLLAEGRGRLWYWMRERSDSPWYSSVQLVRQRPRGDWVSSIETCASNLRGLIATRKESGTL